MRLTWCETFDFVNCYQISYYYTHTHTFTIVWKLSVIFHRYKTDSNFFIFFTETRLAVWHLLGPDLHLYWAPFWPVSTKVLTNILLFQSGFCRFLLHLKLIRCRKRKTPKCFPPLKKPFTFTSTEKPLKLMMQITTTKKKMKTAKTYWKFRFIIYLFRN